VLIGRRKEVAPALTRKNNRVREHWAQRGFSPADLLNLLKPTGAWERYDGLAYDKGSRQKLDVYRPRHAAKAPVLVFFYGGSWQGGSRDLYPFLGTSLAAQGIITVVPDYSIFPPARFPHDNAVHWGGDPARLRKRKTKTDTMTERIATTVTVRGLLVKITSLSQPCGDFEQGQGPCIRKGQRNLIILPKTLLQSS
jgi:hypothetical protein